MKVTIIISTIIALVAADVTTWSQHACVGVSNLLKTSHGTCYNVNVYSIKGCATPYVLRLHEQSDCSDPYVKQCPNDQCCGLGGTQIKSFKCTLA